MADFTLTADNVLEEKISYETLVTKYENGVEQRRQKRTDPIRTFTLNFKNRSSSDMSTVRTFFNTKKGAKTSFTWENPNDSTEYTVRFADDDFIYSRRAFGVYTFKITFIEVL